MTPPPMPAEALAGLHDVVAPAPAGLLPATPAWVVVLALFVLAAAWGGRRALLRRRRSRYRRDATLALRSIEARLGSPTTRRAALAELPVLVKRVALEIAPRDEVAPLSGAPLLELLDRTWSGDAFGAGPGRLLPEIAYGTPDRVAAIPKAEVDALVSLLQKWIPGHRPLERPAAARERAA